MPDLITIQGDLTTVRSLTDVPNLEIIDETGKLIDDNTAVVAAFADAAAQATVEGRGLVVTVVKTEAQYDDDVGTAFAAINDIPYDFGGIV